MVKNVLVVEETEEFGSLIRSALEETGLYQVSLAMNAAEAIEIGNQGDLQLLIIDLNLPGADVPTCIKSIQAVNPNIAVLAIPHDNNRQDPMLTRLPITGILTKPFYLPELDRIVKKALAQIKQKEIEPGTDEFILQQDQPTWISELDLQQDQPTGISEPSAPWLEERGQASQYLDALCSGTPAEALILFRGGQQWAQAGDLTPSQIDGLAAKISEIGVGEGSRGAITTLTQMPGTQRDCILYANDLLANWTLIITYPANTSFGVIRREAQQASDMLKYGDFVESEDNIPHETIPVSDNPPKEKIAPFVQPADEEPAGKRMAWLNGINLPPPEPTAVADQPVPEPSEATDRLPPRPNAMADRLPAEATAVAEQSAPEPSDATDQLPPGPNAMVDQLPPEPTVVADQPAPEPSEATDRLPPGSNAVADQFPPEPSGIMDRQLPESSAAADLLPPEPSVLDDLIPPEPNPVVEQHREIQPLETDSPATIPGDWIPDKPKPESHLPFLEEAVSPTAETAPTLQEHIPLPDAEYYLPVTAVLIPRFPEHRLTGVLADNLKEWVVRLCLAWDCRADEISIDPDFLCLTMSISQETAPSDAILRLQDDLSQRILSAFPEFVDNLPSRRFWAPSYLLISGGPPPKDQLITFVNGTRKGQGLVS